MTAAVRRRWRRSARRPPGTGAVTGITVTDPGSGYTAATVTIGGAGTGATANAVVTTSGSVTAITVDATGGGYMRPVVSITGGGATTAATATVYGGIDAVQLANAGTGYTMPTVDIDAPDDPNGTQATAHAQWNLQTGAITDIIVDNAGSGYSSAPNVVIRDGTACGWSTRPTAASGTAPASSRPCRGRPPTRRPSPRRHPAWAPTRPWSTTATDTIAVGLAGQRRQPRGGASHRPGNELNVTVPTAPRPGPRAVATLGWTASSAVDVGHFGVWLVD